MPADPIVAIQGEPGSFSHAAAIKALGRRLVLAPHATVRSAVDAVLAGEASYCVLPVENTIAGFVAETVVELARPGLTIAGETAVPVRLCLIAVPGAALDRLRVVRSHPVALAQCRRFLDAHPRLRVETVDDTAGAVRELFRRRPVTRAAVASAAAARRYGAVVLRAGIEDRPGNFTRFVVVVAAAPRRTDETDRLDGADRTVRS